MRYKVDNVKNYSSTKGWICGHFMSKDSVLKNSELEVKYNIIQPRETAPAHYHPLGTEICIIIKGKLKWRLDNEEFILGDGDFVFMRNNVIESILEVYEPTTIVSVRTPSVQNNKIIEEEK